MDHGTIPRAVGKAAWRDRDDCSGKCSTPLRRSFRSDNFVVEAPTQSVAKTVAEHAEAERIAIARAWLGRELPAWPTPCPIRVKVTSGEAGGLTSFGFNNGRVTDQSMMVEGRTRQNSRLGLAA